MAEDKTISQLSVAGEIDGTEMIPFAKDGGNGAVSASQLMKSYGMPVVEQTETAVTIQPDVLNKWGEVASLTIDFAAGSEGYAHEYCIEFVSGSTATTLSLPAAVKFPDEPTIEANMRYQISVVNGIALIAGVPFDLGERELANPAAPIGISVLLKNGNKIDYAKMYEDSSFPKAEVEGIVFEKEGMSVIMALEPTQCYFCGGNQVCSTVEVCQSTSIGSGRLNGLEQTGKLRAALTANSAWAVNVAYAHVFGSNTHGYLPALGELYRIFQYKTEISSLLEICGCEGLTKASYWSSTLDGRVDSEGNETEVVTDYIRTVFGVYASGDMDGFNCQGYYWALPIAAYEEGGAL